MNDMHSAIEIINRQIISPLKNLKASSGHMDHITILLSNEKVESTS